MHQNNYNEHVLLGLVYILHHEHRPPVMSTAPTAPRISSRICCRLLSIGGTVPTSNYEAYFFWAM
jgi:hypothetical protein